jgi:hypothetical protein
LLTYAIGFTDVELISGNDMPKLISLISSFKLPTRNSAAANAQAVKPKLIKPEQFITLKPVTIHLAQREVRAASFTAAKPTSDPTPSPALSPVLSPASTSSQSVESKSSQALESKALPPSHPSITNIEAFVVAPSGDKVQLKKLQAGKGEQASSVLTQPVLYDAVEKSLYVITSEGSKLTVPHKVCEIGGEAVTDADGNPVVILTNRKGQKSCFIVNQETQTLQPSQTLLKSLATAATVTEGQAPSDASYLHHADLRNLEKSNGSELMASIFLHQETPVIRIPIKGKAEFVYRSLEDFSKDINDHIGQEIKKLSEKKTSTPHAIRVQKDTEKKLLLLERIKQTGVICSALLHTGKVPPSVATQEVETIIGFSHLPGGEGIELLHEVGGKEQRSPVEYNQLTKSLYVRSGHTNINVPHETYKINGEPVTDCNGYPVVVLKDKDGENYYFTINTEENFLSPLKSLLNPLLQKNIGTVKNQDTLAYEAYKENIDLAVLKAEDASALRRRIFVHEGKAVIKVPMTKGEPLFAYRPLNEFAEEIFLSNAKETNKFSLVRAAEKDLIPFEKEMQERVELASQIEKIRSTYSSLIEDSFGILENTQAFKNLKDYQPKNLSAIKSAADFEAVYQTVRTTFKDLEKELQNEWRTKDHNGIIGKDELHAMVLSQESSVLKDTLLKEALGHMLYNTRDSEGSSETRDDFYDKDKPALNGLLARRQMIYKDVSNKVYGLVAEGIFSKQEGETFLQEQLLRKLNISMESALTSNMFLFNPQNGLLDANDQAPWVGDLNDMVWSMAAGFANQNTPITKKTDITANRFRETKNPRRISQIVTETGKKALDMLSDTASNLTELMRSRSTTLTPSASLAASNLWEKTKTHTLENIEKLVTASFEKIPDKDKSEANIAFGKGVQLFFQNLVNDNFLKFEAEKSIALLPPEEISDLVTQKANALKTEERQRGNPHCYASNMAALAETLNASTVTAKTSPKKYLEQQNLFKAEIPLTGNRTFFTKIMDWFAGRSAEQSALLGIVNSSPDKTLADADKSVLRKYIQSNKPTQIIMNLGKVVGFEIEKKGVAKTPEKIDDISTDNVSLQNFFLLLNKAKTGLDKNNRSEILGKIKAESNASPIKIKAYEESRLKTIKSLMQELEKLDPIQNPEEFLQHFQNPSVFNFDLIKPLLDPSDTAYAEENKLLLDGLRQGFYHASKPTRLPDSLVIMLFGKDTPETRAASALLVSKPWLDSQKVLKANGLTFL